MAYVPLDHRHDPPKPMTEQEVIDELHAIVAQARLRPDDKVWQDFIHDGLDQSLEDLRRMREEP